MSNSNNIISNFNHTLKVGDQMIKMYGNKIVKLEFVFNEDGDDLKQLLIELLRKNYIRKNYCLEVYWMSCKKLKMMVPCNRRYFRPLSLKGRNINI